MGGAVNPIRSSYYDASNYSVIAFDVTGNSLTILQVEGGVIVCNKVTTAVYRDPSAWYHVVINTDLSRASGDKNRIYVNGVLQTCTGTDNQVYQLWPYPAYTQAIGYAWASGTYLDGYLAEINFIDGQALTPSSFGQTDPVTNVWGAKKYAGTYGTNGFYLKFSNPTFGTDLTSTATLTAPFGGTAANCKVSDGVYVTSNTSSGSTFTFVQQDFGASIPLTFAFIGNLYWTGGASTFQVQYGDDATWTTFKVAGILAVTGSAQSFVCAFTGSARYVRLTPTAFGTNGQANVDAFIVYQGGISSDHSGNANNWVTNNVSLTAGITYDSMVDVPTLGPLSSNYCVLNPLTKGANIGITEGNLNALGTVNTATGNTVLGSMAVSSGKWYAEFRVTNTYNFSYIGAVDPDNPGGYAGAVSSGYGLELGTGATYNVSAGPTITGASAGDTVMLALDMDTGKIWWGKNGAWGGSGNPSAGTGQQYSGLTGTKTIGVTAYSSSGTINANFGQRPFAYTPPTGFKALNTQNLPDATIKKGNQYMDVLTYTGDGTDNRAITGLNFQPDLAAFKTRNVADNFRWVDAVRGVDKFFLSNTSDAETTDATMVSSFNSNGLTFGTDTNDRVNWSAKTYAAFAWKESVSAGFDIVTFTGTGGNTTVNHSLGVAPKMMIAKRRDTGPSSWVIAFDSSGFTWSSDYYQFDTAAKRTDGASTVWRQAPTSSVFSIGSAFANGGTYVAYLFAEVAGYSKFGSYTGNGSADGPFVYCGFRPRWIMVKRTDSSTNGNWEIIDTSRDTYNQAFLDLSANLSAVENATDGAAWDILSNGFKCRDGTSTGTKNVSGGTYIFAAFAENPFKNSLAR
jgi:hypothetical protein